MKKVISSETEVTSPSAEPSLPNPSPSPSAEPEETKVPKSPLSTPFIVEPQENKPEKTVYIYYFDGIDNSRVKIMMQLLTDIIGKEKPTVIYFLFASNGGGVDAGVTFYNFLKSLPVKIIIHNIGTIDSIATVIFCAGAIRYASPHSTFLFHGVTLNMNGSFSLPQINEIKTRIEENHNTIAGIIHENTKLTIKEIKNSFDQGITRDVRFALKKGIIHKIKPAQIPQEAVFVSININS
jgi:ATP-dependent Clp protease, protease subunit